jgi:hypothetical protein
MRLKPKATVRMRAPAEPPTVGDLLAERAARRRRALAQGRSQINVAAATLIAPGRPQFKGAVSPLKSPGRRKGAAEESAP